MDLFDAAAILAKEVAWKHRDFAVPKGPEDIKPIALHCDLCRALYFVWRHPKPVTVSAVHVRAVRGNGSDVPSDEDDAEDFPSDPPKVIA